MGQVASTFDGARQSLTESLQAQGAAGGGRGLAMGNALAIEEAKAKAGAGNNARRQTEATGLSLLSSATNLGRGFPSQGMQAGQVAAANGQGATGNVAGLSGLTGAGYGAALSGYGVGINGLLGQYQAQANASGQQNGIFGDLLGAGAMAYGMYRSSKEAKTAEGDVDGKQALAGISDLNVDRWTYKPGEGDGGTHDGPYAEDVQREFGDRVAPGGAGIRMVAMSEINRKAIAQLSQELKALQAEIAQLEAA